ncbi:MAG: DUF1667 domain-containing protein [Erysipelotrichaceae bacterium]|nr:DUF1667 domain-containing protein [Erysipelotrichaceae bacterium]
MNKEMVCIVCPMGCRLKIEITDGKPAAITGNSCPRGYAYAMKEYTAPERVLTTTVKVHGGIHPLVSVKSAQPLPKSRLFEAMDIINQLVVEAPVSLHDVLISNILNTGVDIIATANNKKAP